MPFILQLFIVDREALVMKIQQENHNYYCIIAFMSEDTRSKGFVITVMKTTRRNNNMSTGGKWFEPRSLSRLCGLIVRVRVVPRRTVVGDIDRRFDNLSGSHHQSHVNCVSSVYGIYV